MATIKTAISLYDGVTGPLRSMVKVMDTVIGSFERMGAAADSNGLVGDMIEAREALTKMAGQLDTVETAISSARQQQNSFNRSLQSGGSAADALLDKIKGFAAAYGGMQAVEKLVGLSDQLTSVNARLGNAQDMYGGGDLDTLEAEVMGMANRTRTAYADAASAVASLGMNARDAFSGLDEVIAFQELINKQFVIGGASAQEQQAAMLQLTQAMASGVLRGEELNSIFEQAPGIIQNIAGYLGVSVGEIREMASEGQITADVVKNAMFGAADEINRKFEAMPMTWGQVWTTLGNAALTALQPVLNLINWVANNLDIIAPIVLGIAGAFAVYAVAAYGAQAATAAWSAIQAVFNAVMAMNPVAKIVMVIVLLIGLIYAVVAAINNVTGQTISATGIIMGALATAGAFILNLVIGVINAIIQLIWTVFVTPFIGIIEWVLNVANGGFNSFGDAVANLIGQIIGWFLNLGKVVTTIIDAIFGTNWTAGLESLQDKVTSWGKNENAITLDYEPPQLNRIAYSDAWDAGYSFGQGVDAKVGGLFGGGGSAFGGDYGSLLADTAGNTADTAANTAAAANALDVAKEELAYMKDLAERKSINRYTTARIVLNMQNENHIASDKDLDGIYRGLGERLIEEINVSAEGAHISG